MNSNKYIFKNRISQHLDILHWVMGYCMGVRGLDTEAVCVCVCWGAWGGVGWRGPHCPYTFLPRSLAAHLSMRTPDPLAWPDPQKSGNLMDVD